MTKKPGKKKTSRNTYLPEFRVEALALAEAIHGERFTTREIMRQTVFEYIEVDYNRTRRHSFNGFISLEAFEAKNVA